MNFGEFREYLNQLPDSKVQEIFEKVNTWWKKIYPEDSLLTYEEYKRNLPKMRGPKCFVHFCTCPVVFKQGDSRFYAGFCEEHASIKFHYLHTLKHNPKLISKKSIEWRKNEGKI